MHRLISSAASSSCGKPEQPPAAFRSCSNAEQPSTSLRSAEQPATPSHIQFLSIRDVQRWLAEEPIASCSSVDMQRIREAVAMLSRPKPSKEWLEEVLQEFRGKVIKAANKLQEKLSASAEQPASSTVEHSAPMDTADSVDLDEDPVLAELRAGQRKRAQDSAAERPDIFQIFCV